MLAKERSKLMHSYFILFITPDKRTVFADLLAKMVITQTKQSCELSFSIDEKPIIYIHIEGFFAEAQQKYLLTVVDTSEKRKTEERCRKLNGC